MGSRPVMLMESGRRIQAGRVNPEGVITGNPEEWRKTRVGCGRWIELDLRLDSVEDLGLPGYARSLDLQDELKAEANPEDRFFPQSMHDKGLGLGILVRVSGTGGENDQVGGLDRPLVLRFRDGREPVPRQTPPERCSRFRVNES